MVEAAKRRWLVRNTRGALLALVLDFDAAQEQVALPAGQLVEEDDFVALDRTMFGNGTALQDAVVGVVLHAGDEEDALLVEGSKPVVVVVAAIEDHDGSRLEAQGGGNAAFVHAALGENGVAGQQALMVEQQMQLHGSLGALVLRTVENRGAQFDHGGVQREQFVFETKTMAAGDFAATAQQLIEHAAIQLPGTVLVGIGQSGAAGRVGQSQMPQLAFAGGQPAANLPQRLGSAQMAEQHGYELPPAGKSAGVALGAVFPHRLLELMAGKQLQHLAENARYSCHGGG
jgi:hypothetical protein